MTTQSQQQRMAQPETARAGDSTTAASTSAQGGATDGFVGGACGAGAGAAIIWQPVTVKNRSSGAR